MLFAYYLGKNLIPLREQGNKAKFWTGTREQTKKKQGNMGTLTPPPPGRPSVLIVSVLPITYFHHQLLHTYCLLPTTYCRQLFFQPSVLLVTYYTSMPIVLIVSVLSLVYCLLPNAAHLLPITYHVLPTSFLIHQ